MRTRDIEPYFHLTPEAPSSCSTIEVPDSMLRPKRKGTYVISGSWGRLIHRVAALFGSPKSRKNVEPEILLEVLKAECDFCLDQLSKLQANVKRTAYTLHRIKIQTDPRWRTEPTYPDRYSTAEIAVDSEPKPCIVRPRRHQVPMDDCIIMVPKHSAPPAVSDHNHHHHAMMLPSRATSPVLEDDTAKSEPRSTSSILEDLPSVDDLVRRWINIHGDSVGLEA